MMGGRLGHGHTFLAGFVGGLALAAHAFVLLAVGAFIGAGVILAGSWAVALVRWVRSRLEGGRV